MSRKIIDSDNKELSDGRKENLTICIIVTLMPENAVEANFISENLAPTRAGDDYNHRQEPGRKLFLKSFWGRNIAETDQSKGVFVAEYYWSIPYTKLRDMLDLCISNEVLACVNLIGQHVKLIALQLSNLWKSFFVKVR